MLLALLAGCAPDPGGDDPGTTAVAGPSLALGDVAPTTLVVIQVDTLRADATPWGGSIRDTFPRMGGREGWVYVEHAVAEGTWTAPSTASLLSGTGQEVHGVRAFAADTTSQPPIAVNTWPEWLWEQGWTTALFSGSNLLMGVELSLGAGFETRQLVTDEPRNAESVFGQANAWLRDTPTDTPVLLFLHPMDPHGPYRPAPGDAGTWVEPESLPFDPEDPDEAQVDGIITAVSAAEDEAARAEVLDRVRRAYDEQLLGLDRSLQIVFQMLADTGRLDHAVVVLTADHGESFLEGAPPWLGHGGVIRHEIVHVPMLFWTATSTTASVDCVASNEDVFPTLADLAGVEPLPDRDGLSLLRGCRRQAFSAIYEDRGGGEELEWIGVEDGVAAVTRDCVHRDQRAFDLVADPLALTAVPTDTVTGGADLDVSLDAYAARIAAALGTPVGCFGG